MKNFINKDKIFDLLEEAKNPSHHQAETIIRKSFELKGLNPEESSRSS